MSIFKKPKARVILTSLFIFFPAVVVSQGMRDTASEVSICIEEKKAEHQLRNFLQLKKDFPGSVTAEDEAAFNGYYNKAFSDSVLGTNLTDKDKKLYNLVMESYKSGQNNINDIVDKLGDLSNTNHPVYSAWLGVSILPSGSLFFSKVLRSKPIVSNSEFYGLVNELHRHTAFYETVYRPKGNYFFDYRPGNRDLEAVAAGKNNFKLATNVLACFAEFDPDIDVKKCNFDTDVGPINSLIPSDDNTAGDEYSECESAIEELKGKLTPDPDYSVLVDFFN